MQLIEVLWKQDVDMGFSMDPVLPEAVGQEPSPSKPSSEPDPKANTSLTELLDDDKVGNLQNYTYTSDLPH